MSEEVKEPQSAPEEESLEFIDTLIDGPPVEEEPPVTEGEEAPVKEEEPPAKEEEPPKKEEEPPKPEVKTYKLKGKEYTLDQLVALGLLEDALVAAEQMPHYQRKYETLLEKQREAPEAAPEAAPGGAPAGQPQITPEMVQTRYIPEARKVAEEGWIEPEMVEAFPKFVTNLLYFRDIVTAVQQAVGVLASREQNRDLLSMRNQVDNFINSTCASLAERGSHFEPLKDPEIMKGFREYLDKIDPRVDMIDEAFLTNQWLAYNSEVVLEALRSANAESKVLQDEKRRLARGEGSTPRPAGVAKVEKTHLDDLLEGVFPSGG